MSIGQYTDLELTKPELMLAVLRQKLHVSTSPEIPSFSINDHSVKQVSCTKSLGVQISQNMNWESHMTLLSALGAIKGI